MRWYGISALATLCAELGSASRLQESLENKTQPFADGNYLLPFKDVAKSVIDRVTRRGVFDIFAKKLSKKDCDELFTFPTIAYPEHLSFAVDFHAVGFRYNKRRASIDGDSDDNETGDKEQSILSKRISAFFVRAATGSTVISDVTLTRSGSSVTNHIMGNLGQDGHLEFTLKLAGVQPGDRLTFASRVESESGSIVKDKMEVIVAGNEGFGVISDIDDTIKITNVLNKWRVVVETFYKSFRPVETMAELFVYFQENLKVTTPSGISEPVFYYLSASPWQLFSPLIIFLRKFFPRGELLLNKFNFADVDSLLSISDLAKYKIDNAKRIFAKFPHRKFILIGDSGQKDPEIYGQLFREHQDQVACILIRIVQGINAKKKARLHSPDRFALALHGVPQDRWDIFNQASDLAGVNYKTTCVK